MSDFQLAVEIDRALTLFSTLCEQPLRGQTLDEIAPETGAARDEADRALDCLTASGWVVCTGNTFVISEKAIDLCRALEHGLANESAELRRMLHRYALKGSEHGSRRNG